MSKMYLFLFSKGGAFMCFIESILTFISDGISTLKDTIHGRYGLQTEDIRKMREDIFSNQSSPADDKKKLQNDRLAVRGDFRRAFTKITTGNH
ncbi:MAG: hypothetical protein ACTTKJ_06600 [Prevotella koreensis]|uniref:hypothetical protein n=1 Tax=Prevotella koreensis TaxID=2490854 RepID=UPI003FA064FE